MEDNDILIGLGLIALMLVAVRGGNGKTTIDNGKELKDSQISRLNGHCKNLVV